MSEDLFTPIKVGNMELSNRIVLAPLTRFRNEDDGSPIGSLVPEHYAQRALVPGTLLIAEATDASPLAGGYDNVPGIYTPEHVAAWKKVTDAVHAKGGFMFLQIWAIGRVNPGKKQPDVISASEVQEGDYPKPRELTVDDIVKLEDDFTKASVNAIEAGFDGIEIHGAHGYLFDQFFRDHSNLRTDSYGGSIENRARFLFETLDKIVAAIGPEKTAVRLSPTSEIQGMKMADPVPTFTYIVNKIQQDYPKLAYIHMVEPRVSGYLERDPLPGETTDIYRDLFDGPWIAAGGFTPELAKAYVSQHKKALVAFGRYFISNPDLVAKIKEGIPLVKYDREKFYIPKSTVGYLDYPYAEELKGKYY